MRITPEVPDRPRASARVVLCTVSCLAWPMPVPAQSDVYVYPAGCFDSYGRPLKPDPADLAKSLDPACQPPDSGTLMRGSRSGSPPAPGSGPSMQPGSINLPPMPVPVPGGIGVMNP
jgi:hypothetical protein